MPPATVALFCICIAFVPLLALGGVAGYLFRPLAMAVVFAMIASYILTYTLVPTMAHFLLRNISIRHSEARRQSGARPPPSRRLRPLSARLRALFRAVRGRAMWACCNLALRHRALVRRRLPLLSRCCRSASRRFSARTSFPSVDVGRDQDPHARADRERGSRRRRALADQVEQKIRSIIPPDRIDEHRRQHRPADQRHQHLLRQFRNDRRLRRRYA